MHFLFRIIYLYIVVLIACISSAMAQQEQSFTTIKGKKVTLKANLDIETSFMPVGLGYKTYYVQNNRLDCQFGPLMPVTVLILPKPGKPHLTLQNIIN